MPGDEHSRYHELTQGGGLTSMVDKKFATNNHNIECV